MEPIVEEEAGLVPRPETGEAEPDWVAGTEEGALDSAYKKLIDEANEVGIYAEAAGQRAVQAERETGRLEARLEASERQRAALRDEAAALEQRVNALAAPPPLEVVSSAHSETDEEGSEDRRFREEVEGLLGRGAGGMDESVGGVQRTGAAPTGMTVRVADLERRLENARLELQQSNRMLREQREATELAESLIRDAGVEQTRRSEAAERALGEALTRAAVADARAEAGERAAARATAERERAAADAAVLSRETKALREDVAAARAEASRASTRADTIAAALAAKEAACEVAENALEALRDSVRADTSRLAQERDAANASRDQFEHAWERSKRLHNELEATLDKTKIELEGKLKELRASSACELEKVRTAGAVELERVNTLLGDVKNDAEMHCGRAEALTKELSETRTKLTDTESLLKRIQTEHLTHTQEQGAEARAAFERAAALALELEQTRAALALTRAQSAARVERLQREAGARCACAHVNGEARWHKREQRWARRCAALRREARRLAAHRAFLYKLLAEGTAEEPSAVDGELVQFNQVLEKVRTVTDGPVGSA